MKKIVLTTKEKEYIEYKLTRYMKIFEKKFPNRHIKEKNYDITIFRNLIFYFLNKEKDKGIRITYSIISDYFDSTPCTVRKGIAKVKDYVYNPIYAVSSCNLNYLKFFMLLRKEFVRTNLVNNNIIISKNNYSKTY